MGKIDLHSVFTSGDSYTVLTLLKALIKAVEDIEVPDVEITEVINTVNEGIENETVRYDGDSLKEYLDNIVPSETIESMIASALSEKHLYKQTFTIIDTFTNLTTHNEMKLLISFDRYSNDDEMTSDVVGTCSGFIYDVDTEETYYPFQITKGRVGQTIKTHIVCSSFGGTRTLIEIPNDYIENNAAVAITEIY